MKILFYLSVAGALGTLARFGLSELARWWIGSRFPWGTLLVNSIGCFLFGVLWMLTGGRAIGNSHLRLVCFTGFMGAFTTFSAVAFDTAVMLKQAQWGTAAINVLANNLLGLSCMFLGFLAAHSASSKSFLTLFLEE